MDDWIDVTADIEVGEDGRHLAGYFPTAPAPHKGFLWNAVPTGFRVRKVVRTVVKGLTTEMGAAFIVERAP